MKNLTIIIINTIVITLMVSQLVSCSKDKQVTPKPTGEVTVYMNLLKGDAVLYSLPNSSEAEEVVRGTLTKFTYDRNQPDKVAPLIVTVFNHSYSTVTIAIRVGDGKTTIYYLNEGDQFSIKL